MLSMRRQGGLDCVQVVDREDERQEGTLSRAQGEQSRAKVTTSAAAFVSWMCGEDGRGAEARSDARWMCKQQCGEQDGNGIKALCDPLYDLRGQNDGRRVFSPSFI